MHPFGVYMIRYSKLLVLQMPRYKRTDFEEEETSSMASMAVDAPMNPPTTSVQVRYTPGRKRNLWERASPLERALLVCCALLLLLVLILSAVLHSYSGSHTVQVVHITATNGSVAVNATNGKVSFQYEISFLTHSYSCCAIV